MAFTYHHSRAEGWVSICEACVDAGFHFINAHPIKAEMSVAMPKTQAKEPIDVDMILVCRKQNVDCRNFKDIQPAWDAACERARFKAERYVSATRNLSKNDIRIIIISHYIVELCPGRNANEICDALKEKLISVENIAPSFIDHINNAIESKSKALKASQPEQLTLF